MTPKERQLSGQLREEQAMRTSATLREQAAATAKDQAESLLRITQTQLAETTANYTSFVQAVEDIATANQYGQITTTIQEGRENGMVPRRIVGDEQQP